MNLTRFLARITAGLIVVALAACGGGGGGGGGGVTNPPQYTGNTNAAVITAGNASKLTSNVLGSDDSAATIVGVSTKSISSTQNAGGGLAQLVRRLNQSIRDTVLRANTGRRVVSAVQVEQTDPCDGGMGSVRTSGTLSDVNFTGTLAVNYVNCLIDGETVNGAATLRVDEFSFAFPQGIPADSTLSFEKLEIRGPGISVDARGSQRDQLNFGTNTETITVNLVTRNNNTGKTSKTENFVFLFVYDNIFSPSSLAASVSGLLFDHDHGFVSISTNAPLLFSTPIQEFPGSGQIFQTGAGNARIRATALSALMVRLELDVNGDGVYENTATMKWTDLSGPVGADLGDTDNDGMHDSWETANGLLFNGNDASDDKDGDGASNFSEYLAGTDPSNASSTPPIVDLSITATHSPNAVVTGGSLTYTITVFNSSSSAAANVVVTDTLPASVTLTSVTASQGSCSGASSITCVLGTLNAFGNATVTVVVTTTTEGVINNTATVSGGLIDPSTSNNIAIATTTVGQPIAGIQALIDSAAPGDTVVVGPGIYVGGLNFNSRNIVLQSGNGPASTIIHGNQGTAVQIGPNGAIKGFTITGSFADFGAGIAVSGQGTLISGNIFDGNAGLGVAIYGNTASPTIERNVFRNNSCDNQSISGVVVFVNSSSPLIVNNIFENNQCRGINLTLPAGNAPQVINNTFVGNRTGIRVYRGVPQVTQIYRNNMIVQNGIGLEVEFGADADNPVWENNLVFGNTTDYQGTAIQTGTNGNISADPMFINGATGNYRLQPGSPAIDAGSSVGAPIVDFDGTSRPINGNWDIGAFEAP